MVRAAPAPVQATPSRANAEGRAGGDTGKGLAVLLRDASVLPVCSRAYSSATNRLIEAKDKASIQVNIGHVNGASVWPREPHILFGCGGPSGRLPRPLRQPLCALRCPALVRPRLKGCRATTFAVRSRRCLHG